MNIIKESTAKEVQGSKMAIDRNGILALFCGQFNTIIINLNDNSSLIKPSIGQKFKEISSCRWSKLCDNIALGLNNICKIYDCEMNKLHSLKGHNSLITSIDWHPGTKHQIITSSYDNSKSVCIWDVRNSNNNPVATVCDTSAAVKQVKWHQFNAHVFGTCSDSDIKLWDRRSLLSPISIVSAHLSNVSDFEWLLRDDFCFVSCGQFDRKLKLWNVTEDNRFFKYQVEEGASMSHCKLNQTGDFIMTLTTPENIPDNQFTLWDISSGSDLHKISSSFLSSNTIIDFEWRKLSSDCLQIVSLHKNFDFKIWDVNDAVDFDKRIKRKSSLVTAADSCSSNNGRFYLSPSPLSVGDISSNITTVFSETFTNNGIRNEVLEDIKPRYSDSNLASKIKTLRVTSNDVDSRIQKEFDKLVNSSHIVYEKYLNERKVIACLTPFNGKCSILFIYRDSLSDNLILDVTVLPEYSDKLRIQNLEELEKIVRNTASKNSGGILKCVDVAMEYLNKLSSRVCIRTLRTPKENSSSTYCNLPDMLVPYPRTCGARFNPSGLLVCFTSPVGYVTKFHSTPRSFADIAKHSNSTTTGKDLFYGFPTVPSKIVPVRSFKSGNKKNKSSEISSGDLEFSSRMHSSANIQKHNFNIYIYNAQRLSLFSLTLAQKYSIDISDIENLCEVNSSAVADTNRKDLIEFWQYCTILANANKPNVNEFNNKMKPWPSQLFGRQMSVLWLEHFLNILDIQSAAMLILVMLAIDLRFDAYFDSKYDYSAIAKIPRNVSTDLLHETLTADNSLTPTKSNCINVTFDGLKFYKVYDDKSNAALIISGSSFDGQNRHYNNSFGETEHHSVSMKPSDKWSDMLIRHRESCRLIDPNKLTQYGLIILHYARILSAQNMLTAATKISRKILPTTFFSNLSIQDQFSARFLRNSMDNLALPLSRIDDSVNPILYSDCSQRSAFPRFEEPNLPKIQVVCIICRLGVKGLLSLCSLCNHGGHIDHITRWFLRASSQGYCPTGCGCHCSTGSDHLQDFVLPIS